MLRPAPVATIAPLLAVVLLGAIPAALPGCRQSRPAGYAEASQRADLPHPVPKPRDVRRLERIVAAGDAARLGLDGLELDGLPLGGLELDGVATGGSALPLPAAARAPGRVVRLLGGIGDGPSRARIFFAVARPLAGRVDEVLGVGVATWTQGAAGGSLQQHDDRADWRFFGRADPLFGAAVLQADMGVTTGFDYVFGVRGDAATHRVYVARVPHGRTTERRAYRFHTETGEWAPDVQRAAPLFAGAGGGLSVTWNPHLQAFLAVHSRPAGGGLRVVARTSRRPEGPWSAETLLLDVPGHAGSAGGDVFRGAREHGHLADEGGRVVVVSVPGPGESGPVLYRVEFP